MTEGIGELYEAIHYDLSYFGEDPDIERCLVQAISQLPEKVANFALNRCRFLSAGRTCVARTLPGRLGLHSYEKRTRNIWLILLDEKIIDEDGEPEILAIIAHEIAHAWLKHDRFHPDLPKTCERDAANLAKTWGFSGRATDPEFCDAQYH